jgi:hypothetical protein
MHPDGYFALVLAEPSAALLRERFATLPSPVAHHCTIAHGIRDPARLPAVFAAEDVGRAFTLRVVGYATRADGGVQAVVVALVLGDGRVLERGFSTNAIPHVTVATDGVTEPVEANALLAEGFERVTGPVLAVTLLHSDAWREG